MEEILPGEVAWYVTGRFYAAEGGSLRDAGYFLHVQGIDAPLFSGKEKGESTAHLTFLAEPFTSTNVQNGDLTVGLDAVGDFAVYFHPEPAASFDDPASFGAGEEVARFRRVAVVSGATVGTGSANEPVFALNVFSARLIHSRPFTLGGQRYDLRALMPHGITQWGTAASTPIADTPGFRSVIPFIGSAVAIGARNR